ncbi:complex I subunit 5 family protein [Nitrosococcus oceani]|uniref:NADH dehydrogenase (Quinone) n=2 Tax=Nitrosococcus oceani TaxID=1229 RepID=Q3JBL6_NITOC|nr:proton-conducting transporter membrane subunit [Nitrosococcus oceani]ABA57780.1 NADH dehydrogenase (quinone) [Nitrosococcus oceani ATCC 19707]EDZ67348.1 NADH-Ubiquinone/plastoquinone (complex I), domain protein [Nitrosococcus oceani AFC27]KFI19797.1 NADH dehydrogenase [Nitrosococcus oceani C-27]KFI23009.1 NADH dehydrogenase [Nitrosococcus oceani]
MNWSFWLPVLILLSSLGAGIVIFFLPQRAYRTRTTLNMAAATLKLLLVAALVWGVFHHQSYETRLPLLPEMDLLLRADTLSVLFITLSSILWFFTTLYAIGYLEASPHRSRFFGFFSLCVSATVGIALAGNLITFFIFYEMLTLSTYPLVTHRGTKKSLRAGKIYLGYTLMGGVLLLTGMAWLQTLAGPLSFTEGGLLAEAPPIDPQTLTIIFTLLIAGVGVKAALVPLHGWLPQAMVAPAPVSALLHAVAVVKAGAFGIVRIVDNVFGVEFVAKLGVAAPLAWLASFTIIYGSVRALFQDDLKRRLAYSTISQVSYIALGIALLNPVATIGAMAHLVHQGLMKITLFFCAGNLAQTLGIHRISEMAGVGRRMPWTMTAFTLGALGMIGVPPLAGFISKWYLGYGAVLAEAEWVLGILALSSVLNAAYFLPILYRAWFSPQKNPWPEETSRGRLETHWMLLLPPLITAAMALGAGLLAHAPFSPAEWARLIAVREYPSP